MEEAKRHCEFLLRRFFWVGHVISPDQNPRSLQRVSVEAPLGLIFIESDESMSTTLPEVIIKVHSGNYKGVKVTMIMMVL